MPSPRSARRWSRRAGSSFPAMRTFDAGIVAGRKQRAVTERERGERDVHRKGRLDAMCRSGGDGRAPGVRMGREESPLLAGRRFDAGRAGDDGGIGRGATSAAIVPHMPSSIAWSPAGRGLAPGRDSTRRQPGQRLGAARLGMLRGSRSPGKRRASRARSRRSGRAPDRRELVACRLARRTRRAAAGPCARSDARRRPGRCRSGRRRCGPARSAPRRRRRLPRP